MQVTPMTPREIADLMAYVEKNPKATVEVANFGDHADYWITTGKPLWNFGIARYRIKPRRVWVRFNPAGSIMDSRSTDPASSAIDAAGYVEFVEVIK